MRHHRNDLCIFLDSGSGPGVEGSNPFAPTTSNRVRPGDMGYTMYRLHYPCVRYDVLTFVFSNSAKRRMSA